MMTIGDIETGIGITAGALTIADVIKNWIFEYMEKNSPIVKDFKKSIGEIVDQRYKESNRELKFLLHNYLGNFGDSENLEDEILWLGNDKDIFPEEFGFFLKEAKKKLDDYFI